MIVYLIATVLCFILIKQSVVNLFIAANHTISFQPGWSHIWFSGVYVSEHIVNFSDNHNGLDITAFLVDSSATVPGNRTVNLDEFANQSIPGYSDQERRTLIPVNYYNHEPMYLLQRSTITLYFLASMPFSSDDLLSAFVYIFSSHEDALNYYNRGKDALKGVSYFVF